MIKEVSERRVTWTNNITVDVGDTVYYRVRAQNTGNITLTGLSVTDPACSLVRGPDAPGDDDAVFEVGETWVYTCNLVAVAGTQNNTATADSSETPPDTDGASYFGNAPALNVIKEVSGECGWTVDQNITVDVGDTVYYRVRAQNTGNITLTGLSVTDPACSLVRGPDTPGDDDAVFEVGETWVYTCNLVAVAGTQNNTATADSSETPPDTDGASYFGNAPALNVIKEVSDDDVIWVNNVTVNVGDTVYYRVRAQNTGNITLTGLSVTDPACSLVRGPDAPGDDDAVFEVGETWVYTCNLVAVAGTQNNTATADSSETPPDTDGASYFGNAPALNVIKEVSTTPRPLVQ